MSLFGLMALVFTQHAARASCRIPDPKIVWSFPADGAVDVPTNIQVFVVTSSLSFMPPQLMVNGRAAMKSNARYGYQVTLEPNTRYVVEVPPTPEAGGTTLTFSFTTGPGAAEHPRAAPPMVKRKLPQVPRELSPACAEIKQAMGCFDTGPTAEVVFETAERPLFWLIEPPPSDLSREPFLWPSACGPPGVLVSAAGCGEYWLRAVNEAGDQGQTIVSCPTTMGDPGGGCAMVGSVGARGRRAGGALAVMLVFSAGVRLRVARRIRARLQQQ
jgi:hypothetical protein